MVVERIPTPLVRFAPSSRKDWTKISDKLCIRFRDASLLQCIYNLSCENP